MNTKWTSNAFSGNEGSPVSQESSDEKFVVLLLYGKNTFGDKIYSYLKITLPDLQQLKIAILAGNGFNPSDFGTVVAAGKGEPADEVRTEVAGMFEVLGSRKPDTSAPAIPAEKKNWDEY